MNRKKKRGALSAAAIKIHTKVYFTVERDVRASSSSVSTAAAAIAARGHRSPTSTRVFGPTTGFDRACDLPVFIYRQCLDSVYIFTISRAEGHVKYVSNTAPYGRGE